jgi:hypothetical protein
MTLLPIIEKLEELKSNDIYGAEIVDAIKRSDLNIYFYYDGFIGLTDVENYYKDLDQKVYEVVKFEGELKLDTQAFNIKDIYNLIRNLNLKNEIFTNTAIKDSKLVCLLKGPSNIDLPTKFGEFFSKKLSFDLNLGMKDFLVESRSLLNLYKIYEATEMENTDEIIDNIITLDENRGINKFINTEEYLKNLVDFNNSNLNVDYPKKIMVIIEAFCSMYVEKRYDKDAKSLKHKDLFELCLIDLRSKYELNDSFLQELERITNPKPQWAIVDKNKF